MKLFIQMMRRMSWLIISGLSVSSLWAGEVRAAVAANFAPPMKEIIELFQKETGHTVKVSYGSSGRFYSQIKEGAPFDIFLSADETNPQKLENEGLAVIDTQFIYATGRLVLWSKQETYVDNKGSVLSGGKFNKLAITNPRLAPYGQAAKETLEKLNLWDHLQSKIVLGESVTQTLQFAATENADLAFISLSQITKDGKITGGGSSWIVPQELYNPIQQRAVLLTTVQNREAAQAFLSFLKSPKSQAIIRSYGYGTH